MGFVAFLVRKKIFKNVFQINQENIISNIFQNYQIKLQIENKSFGI